MTRPAVVVSRQSKPPAYFARKRERLRSQEVGGLVVGYAVPKRLCSISSLISILARRLEKGQGGVAWTTVQKPSTGVRLHDTEARAPRKQQIRAGLRKGGIVHFEPPLALRRPTWLGRDATVLWGTGLVRMTVARIARFDGRRVTANGDDEEEADLGNGPNGIRIRVCGLKGRRPSPLDDGAALSR